jgi:hypothetical protein
MDSMKAISEGHFTTIVTGFSAMCVIKDRLEDKIDEDQLYISYVNALSMILSILRWLNFFHRSLRSDIRTSTLSQLCSYQSIFFNSSFTTNPTMVPRCGTTLSCSLDRATMINISLTCFERLAWYGGKWRRKREIEYNEVLMYVGQRPLFHLRVLSTGQHYSDANSVLVPIRHSSLLNVSQG